MSAFVTIEMDPALAALVTRYVDVLDSYHGALRGRMLAQGEAFAAAHLLAKATPDALIAAALPRLLIEEGRASRRPASIPSPPESARVIYLCVPYFHPSLEIQATRVEFARAFAARLVESGAIVICPVIEHASIAHYLREATAAAQWQTHCRAVMRHASEVLFVKMEGWTQDAFVRDAESFARLLGIPRRFVDPVMPDQVPLESLQFH